MLSKFGLIAAFVLLVGGATCVSAQDANAQRALAKAQFMLRQATSEKADLQQQADSLKKQVDDLTKQLAASKTMASDSKQQLEQKFSGTIEQWKQHDEKMNEQLAATRAQLKEQSLQRAQLEEKLKKQTDNFALCYGNNKKLFDINKELLSHYEQKGFGDVVKQREPFTGIKRVEVENLVQDYQYRLDDLVVSEPAAELGANKNE